jgi:Fe-S cluster assembly protein SufB
MRDENQLHAAVVELVALDNAQIKYSTVQNWYPGDKEGKGGIYNFVTKRGKCRGASTRRSPGRRSRPGSAITWKYPSCILQGDNSVGEFYSVALTNNYQQADTGTKMIHIGKNTKSTIVSKGISAGHGRTPTAAGEDPEERRNARNYSQCDSLLMGDKCGAHTFPYIEVRNSTAQMEHEASTSKIGEDQLFYCSSAASREDAVSMIVNGFCKEVFRELPMEFAVEAQKLLGVSLEGAWDERVKSEE